MNYIGKFISNFKDFYNEINAATLTGAIDVVVVRQEDGSLVSSPFHVRFGKMGVLRSREKVVDIEINGEPVDIHMKLGETGEAFFVEEIEDGVELSPFLGTSPLPASFLQDKLVAAAEKSESSNKQYDSGVENSASSTVSLPKTGNTGDESGSTLVAESGNTSESTLTVQSEATEEPQKQPETSGSQVGVIVRIRKSDVPKEMRDFQTQTEGTTPVVKLRKVPDKSEGQKVHNKVNNNRKVVLEGQGSKTDGEETVRGSKNNRRKRKKRCYTKKQRPKSSGSQSSDTSTTSEAADLHTVLPAPANQEGIFVMDDVDQAEKLLGQASPSANIAQSTSMPLLREKSRDEVIDEWNGNLSRSMGPDFHPFSDTDLSPPPSPNNSRPPTPIKSDTEYEVERQKADLTDGSSQTDENKWCWEWGELPTPPPKTPTRTTASSSDPTSAQANSDSKIKEEGGAKDEDVESGNGPSLPHSPHSVEGAIGGPKNCSDSDFEDFRHPIFDYKGYQDIAFSLCGCLHEYDTDFPESLFMQSLVTYDDFCENPHMFDNPDLVVRLGGKYLNWSTAAPQILSLVLFQRPVPQKLAEELGKKNMPKKEQMRKRSESRGYSWFSSWRRQADIEDSNKTGGEKGSQDATDKEQTTDGCSSDPDLIEVTVAETQTSLPGTPRRQGMRSVKSGTDSSESEDAEELKERKFSGERFKKSLRLSSEQLAKLNLKEGRNEALFSVTTAYQGTTRCKCHIFLWNYDEKIVVSDIDGTITKSDVLGHLLPIVGKDWAQSGVAQLFTKIKNNGYNFLYLSARAIGQARITRDYLKSIKQGDLSLPDGPLLLNPTSLVQAFHREVIEKKPEEFKISCLRDIQALYSSERNPFYSGYGNKINDVWAYRAVGIPISRIFTINHRGELKHELTQTFQSSYSNLSDISNHMFPPVALQETLSEFSSLQYWRPALPDVTGEIEALLAQEPSK